MGFVRRPASFLLTLLAIEFLDEFVFGAREMAWPLIRDDLGLSYFQIGLLLTLPHLTASLIEPFLGIWADLGARRRLILAGGLGFATALLAVAFSRSFLPLVFSFMLLYPSSGAFVSLSQTALMDSDPPRREQNMARWTFAGSLGVVAGPLALGALAGVGADWRAVFIGFALLTLVMLAAAWRQPLEKPAALQAAHPPAADFRSGMKAALVTLRRGEVLRWLILLQFSDLMLDVLYGFLALYFVDVVGVSLAQAGLAVAAWSGFGLLGDFLLIPLLERVDGRRYLQISAVLELVFFVGVLLAPGFWPRVVMLALVGLFNSGWYSILKAGLYAAMPGQSGASLAVENAAGMISGLIPLGLGWAAGQFGLGATLWLLLAGPLALLVGLPRRYDG
jgi:FSR family fosmidomycin resistance protein-like MFS transporter